MEAGFGRAPQTRRATPGNAYALAVSLLVAGLFVANNLAPYLGLNYVGAMTMYASLRPSVGNHLLIRKTALGDAGEYVTIGHNSLREIETPAARQLDEFVSWTRQQNRRVSIVFLRYHLGRVCASRPGSRFELVLRDDSGRWRGYEDVCSEPSMLGYPLITSYPECYPDCHDHVRRWAGTVRPRG